MKTCTRLLIAALLVNAKYWKHSKDPYTGEWLNERLHIRSGLVCSCKKRTPESLNRYDFQDVLVSEKHQCPNEYGM